MSRVTCYTVLHLLRAKVADFGLTMKDNMKVSEEKPAMAVLWSAPEAIGNILQILTQFILCLDFTRAANDPSVLRIYANHLPVPLNCICVPISRLLTVS